MVPWWRLVHCGQFLEVDACVPIKEFKEKIGIGFSNPKCHNTMYRMPLSRYPI
jgi:hypothetical protein